MSHLYRESLNYFVHLLFSLSLYYVSEFLGRAGGNNDSPRSGMHSLRLRLVLFSSSSSILAVHRHDLIVLGREMVPAASESYQHPLTVHGTYIIC